LIFFIEMFQPRQVPSPGGVEKSESKKNYESEKKKTNERKKQGSLQSTVAWKQASSTF
jgi:hypothetical protein